MSDDLASEKDRDSGITDEAAGAPASSRFFWRLVWGAMALLAIANCLLPSSIFPGRYALLFGSMLFAITATQLLHRVPFLSYKEYKLALVVLSLFGAGLIGQRLPEMGPRRNDFSAYYVVGKLVAEHPPGRLYYDATFPDGRVSPPISTRGWREIARRYGVPDAIPCLYPPFFAVLMKPLARLPYTGAYIVWTALAVGLTLAAIWFTLSLGGKRLNTELALILVAGLFSYYPFYEELFVGQVASLLLFCCALGIWLLVRCHIWPSAFCFAFATMIKPIPVLAVPILLFHRKWRWLIAYGCWMAALLVFSVWQAGWPAHAEFIHSVIPSVSCGVITKENVSLVTYIQALFVGHVPSGGYQSSLPHLACAVSKAVALATGAGMMYRFYRHRKQNLVLHLVLALLLSLAISPITWMHYYVIAILPFIYLWYMPRSPGRDALLLILVLVVGSNITIFALRLAGNHVVQLSLAAAVPFLTIALVYFRSLPKESPGFMSEALSQEPLAARR